MDPHLKDEVKKFLIRKMREEGEVVTVISAHPLTDSQEKALKELIPEGQKDMRTEVDTSLIAGFLVKRGSRILDLSVRGRLQQLEHQIISI